MREVILIRFSEIHLKGKNKSFFLKLLKENIKHSLKGIDLKVETIFNRLIISEYKQADKNEIIEIIKKIFGIFSFSIAFEMNTDKKNITDYVRNLKFKGGFKVDVNRADKTFAISSHEFNCILGELILNNNPDSFVDVKTPDIIVHVDIRENGKTYITDNITHALGGMPLSDRRDGLLLLSGGIDSPVAGYFMAKRGLRQDILHFDSFPYTSPQAKQKVINLAQLIKPFIGCKYMYVVSMTKLQEEFHINCKSEYAIALLRRAMILIAEKICFLKNYKAIITGESLGQVASQTIESITLTNSAAKQIPILRPLIGFNKDEIINVANQIGTYATSILPYEDCCTVFLPKNPVIKPKIEIALHEESKIPYFELIENVLSNLEIIEI